MDASEAIAKSANVIIERARREQSKELYLSGYDIRDRLREIPDEVFTLRQLEVLSLDSNDIRVVPDRIRELPNLKKIVLARNPIEKVPDIPGLILNWDSYMRCRATLSRQNVMGIWIFSEVKLGNRSRQGSKAPLLQELSQLTNLKELHIGLSAISEGTKIPKPTGEIRDVIDSIDRFTSLEVLSFFGVLLGDVPPGIAKLEELRTLGMHGAGLREIPEWMGNIKHLRRLWLGMNKLTTLPLSLQRLSEIEAIDLDENQITQIPNVIFRMEKLNYLGIAAGPWSSSKGLIKEIPADILRLPNLKTLDTEKQPVEVPPPEVVKEGVEAIKNYWRQQQDAGVDYLAEAKLIIVGEPGAGKTSLAKKIEDPNYVLKPGEPSTEGIDVVRWSFPSAVRVERDGSEALHQTDFKVNIWDFGGQEIYHATHQFFLTRRSLYALVADDRKEDTDFNYWLQVVELLSDRSPLLIVRNEKQDRQRDIDLSTLRSDFPNLREAFRVNLDTNRGLEALERAIRQELERLPHIGTPLPKTWSKVRAALENDSRNHISLDEYLNVCQENGFKRREDKLQLSGYLHDLGICLHFQDDPVLKNTVILKPTWGTDAVYRVLDDRLVKERRGRFAREDLERIWADEKYATMRDELLQLMMRFQLCYQLPGAKAYIAPQLLSPARPSYGWGARGDLALRYDYDFMPKGLVTRFIVAVNHLIADQSLVWKSGVVLERDGTRAEVVEDYPRRKINVRVGGPDARGLLAIVDDQLERIHASFPRLRYDKYLPCNCEVCQKRDEPFAYPLSELRDFAVQGDQIQCRVSRKLVDAARLIMDVLPSSVRPAGLVAHYAGLTRTEECPPAEPPPVRKEVFVSYAWSDESKALVDKLQAAFAGGDITLVRDKDEVRYKDSIREFMQRIGRGKCVVVVLSKRYLESRNCMFELTEIAARGEMRDRVFPVLLDDAKIYGARDRLRYIKYWEQQKKELDKEMKGVDGEFLQGIREELDLFAGIRNTIAEIVNILGDMNAFTAEQHSSTNFETLLRALEERLSR